MALNLKVLGVLGGVLGFLVVAFYSLLSKPNHHLLEVAKNFREHANQHLVALDFSIERIIANLPKKNSEILVYRFVGPSATGKTCLACIFATALFPHHGGSPEKCQQSTDFLDSNPRIISRLFNKNGTNSVEAAINIFQEADQKLQQYPDGILIILNDYNLAGKSVWEFMSSYLKQESLKTSVVILTDDLTPSLANEYRGKLQARVKPDMNPLVALDIYIEEVQQVFPPDYVKISENDIWIPFLPFHERAIEVLIERTCLTGDLVLKTIFQSYAGMFALIDT